jgi:hypothetical protein
MTPRLITGVLVALALACGGDDNAPAPGTPATQPPPPGTPPAAGAAQAEPTAQPPDSARDSTANRTGLVREVFGYRSGGRDPMRSLLTSGDIRPLLADLRLTTVVYDPRYPARSVAVLRDVSTTKRYDVRVDDALGHMRVVEIRPTEVVLSVEEFGQERQVTLALPKKQEGIP